MKKNPFARWSLIHFSEMLLEVTPDHHGFVRLSGIENGLAGLDLTAYAKHIESQNKRAPKKPSLAPSALYLDAARIGAAFSFCIGTDTYTAIKDPVDDYRSSLVKRPGNLCSTHLPSIPLTIDPHPKGWLFNLTHPATKEVALSVGTDDADDYYPVFVAFHDPKVLQKALELGIHLAYELDVEIETPKIKTNKTRL